MNICSEMQFDGSNSSDSLFLNNNTDTINFEMLSSIYIITSMFSALTNSYVIWLIVRGTRNGLAAEFFSLNLSICELILCVNNFILVLPDLLPEILSVLVVFGQGLAFTIRSMFQCLMCVERYLAVVHPVLFLKYKPLRYRVIGCVVAWIAISSSFGVLTLFYYFSVFQLPLYFTAAQFTPFLSIQLFCLVAVIRVLKRSGPGDRKREKKDENHMKRRAFYVILLITVSTVIIYTPAIISEALYLSVVNYSGILLIIVRYSFSVGGLVQPFLFLYRVGKPPFSICH